MSVEAEFWHERWRSGQIGFHQAAVDRQLVRHWPTLNLNRGSRVFVPLCGKSLDLVWLRDQGHSVVGVELSAVALEAFCMENGVPARRRTRDPFDIYEAPRIELFRGDFFALTRELMRPVDAVYDRAASISWAPELRAAYSAHLAALLRPGARLLLIALEYPQEQMPGPPFSLSAADVARLYSPCFEIRELAREDILASEHRLRARGLTQLTEVVHLLRRRESPPPAIST